MDRFGGADGRATLPEGLRRRARPTMRRPGTALPARVVVLAVVATGMGTLSGRSLEGPDA
ncbi:MAG TPA: hypothetical protein VFN61_08905 [Acidimicrobiales bacterium]|nr:hypothetical protein [Acidimicrobiales bacterium]